MVHFVLKIVVESKRFGPDGAGFNYNRDPVTSQRSHTETGSIQMKAIDGQQKTSGRSDEIEGERREVGQNPLTTKYPLQLPSLHSVTVPE